jgi:DNA repair protein RecO (recombination protein O)
MRVDLNPAFILHRRPYRETSLLLDVFSRDHGRICLLAKGARRAKTGISEILQPYQRLQLAWSGKSELMTLTKAESDHAGYSLKDKRLIAGFYLNELIARMLHMHEAHADLFTAYDESLKALADPDLDEQVAIRLFEKRLLKSIGYGLVLDHDVQSGRSIDDHHDYYYQADRGPARKAPSTSDYIKISGQTLLAIDREYFDTGKCLGEAKQLMRYILNKHLDNKPLASRVLYQSYLDNFLDQ